MESPTLERVANAKKILENDHYGLDDVKKRILEYLAVRKLKQDSKGSILLLVGPPGVGKTSIGRSIAAAMNKPFYRFSVGGMSDPAEIKGHRRTYIGSMCGKVLQGIKITHTKSPVFMRGILRSCWKPTGWTLRQRCQSQTSGSLVRHLPAVMPL